jgi:hypothetical protein
MFLCITFISIFEPCFTAYETESSTYHSSTPRGGHCEPPRMRMV